MPGNALLHGLQNCLANGMRIYDFAYCEVSRVGNSR
jgi:hypothetical protein